MDSKTYTQHALFCAVSQTPKTEANTEIFMIQSSSPASSNILSWQFPYLNPLTSFVHRLLAVT